MRMGSDLYSLIRLVRDCSFKEAVDFLSQYFDVKEDQLILLTEKTNNAKFAKAEQRKNSKAAPYEESVIKEFGYHPYFLERGFNQETLNRYGAAYCFAGPIPLYGRMVLPVRDEDGMLVGFTGRLVQEDDSRPKWKHEGKLHNYLYNMNFAAEPIKQTQTVVLVEGPLKALRLEEAGLHNAVAIWGVNPLSDRQMRLLLESGAFTVAILMDGDEAGQKGALRLKNQLEKYFYVEIINLGVDDVDEIPANKLNELLRKDSICQKFLI